MLALSTPGIYSIGPHILVCILQEEQIPYKFRVGWDFVITIVMVLQLRALGLPELIITAENRGEEALDVSVLFMSLLVR